MPAEDPITSLDPQAERKARSLALRRAWYQANKDRVKARNKAWRETNLEVAKACSKAYYEANRERERARRKAYHEANKEQAKARRAANRERIREQRRAYRAANRERLKAYADTYNAAYHESNKGRRYGLTPDQYAEMVRACCGKCPCCKTPFSAILGERPCVDHCHKTGTVRGIICHRCNRVLGHADDNPEILRACARHLERIDTPALRKLIRAACR